MSRLLNMIHSIRKFLLSESAVIPELVHFWTSFKPERQEAATAVIPGPAERARTYRSLICPTLVYSIASTQYPMCIVDKEMSVSVNQLNIQRINHLEIYVCLVRIIKMSPGGSEGLGPSDAGTVTVARWKGAFKCSINKANAETRREPIDLAGKVCCYATRS